MQRPQTFCFDLDGTLCTNTWGEYEQARPFPWAIERVNALARAGHRILIFTARGGTTGIDWRERTEAQLQAWGVHYDELVFGKPTADVYVDDRTVHVDAWRYGSALTVPLLPGLWALLFGLGVFATRPYLPRAVGWVGLFYLAAGSLLVGHAAITPSLSGWSVGGVFGAGYLATALAFHRNLERPDHA